MREQAVLLLSFPAKPKENSALIMKYAKFDENTIK